MKTATELRIIAEKAQRIRKEEQDTLDKIIDMGFVHNVARNAEDAATNGKERGWLSYFKVNRATIDYVKTTLGLEVVECGPGYYIYWDKD